MIALEYLSQGDYTTRAATSMIQPGSNSGPSLPPWRSPSTTIRPSWVGSSPSCSSRSSSAASSARDGQAVRPRAPDGSAATSWRRFLRCGQPTADAAAGASWAAASDGPGALAAPLFASPALASGDVSPRSGRRNSSVPFHAPHQAMSFRAHRPFAPMVPAGLASGGVFAHRTLRNHYRQPGTQAMSFGADNSRRDSSLCGVSSPGSPRRAGCGGAGRRSSRAR